MPRKGVPPSFVFRGLIGHDLCGLLAMTLTEFEDKLAVITGLVGGFRGPSLSWTFMFLGVEDVVSFRKSPGFGLNFSSLSSLNSHFG